MEATEAAEAADAAFAAADAVARSSLHGRGGKTGCRLSMPAGHDVAFTRLCDSQALLVPAEAAEPADAAEAAEAAEAAAAAPAAAAASPARTEDFSGEVLSEEEEEWLKEWAQYNYRLRVCEDRQLFELFKSAADELKWRGYAPVDVLRR